MDGKQELETKNYPAIGHRKLSELKPAVLSSFFAGVDVKTISARLGHALTSTTMNIYVHVLQDSDKKAADAISNLLGKQL